MSNAFVLMSASRINRTLRRISFEILEHVHGSESLAIFGVDRRGFRLARRIKSFLQDASGRDIPCIKLPVKDGIPSPALMDQIAGVEFAIVIDDVIFSGITAMAALDSILTTIKPQNIHLAVLVDRGHRRYPIEAQFVGLSVPTKLNEHVMVMLEGVDNCKEDMVMLEAGSWET